jgi:quercetin dioxygenase-like cupin family protein
METDRLVHDFPTIITNLPIADIKIDGVKGWVVQGDTHQIVFFEIASATEVPEHNHNAQWGIILEGKVELTIEGKTKLYERGDEYFIPSQARHSAKFLTRSRVIDIFNERKRYKLKRET